MRAAVRFFGGSTFRHCCILIVMLASAQAGASNLANELELLKTLGASPASRAAAVAEGRNNASFCANCHGDTGNSKYPEVPNLAGQNPVYLLTQMRKFETGERKDEFMQPLIKLLSDRERATIALFYADAAVVPSRDRPGPTAARGGGHYNRLCARCHGEKAHGSDSVPRLAGQQANYLRISLDRYRTSSGERFFPQMTAATLQIPASDVDAMVDYLASLKH